MVTSNNPGGLPGQQYVISSEATAEGDKAGKYVVSRTISVLQPIFDYALFSGDSIIIP
jgi:hypothetical protein